jgi:putative transcriptional regulator
MTRCLGVLVLALTIASAAIGATRPSAGPERDPQWLTGRFLVATEEMEDPRFDHTLIYLVLHDAAGAMGLVVNRPLGELPLARVVEPFGLDPDGVSGSILVHYGGPVQPTRGFVLHTADYSDPATRLVLGGIALTSDRAILDAIAHARGPHRTLLAFGYAGWAAGQLESEMRRGGWITVPADAGLLFDEDNDRKWERAMARREIQL